MLPRGSGINLAILRLSLENFFKFYLNSCSQPEGVQGRELCREFLFSRRRYQGGFHDPLVGRFKKIIAPDRFRSNSIFGQQFNRGQEEIMEQTPFLGIEVV